MPRAMGIFCKLGWPMLPYPVDHQTKPGNLFRFELAFSSHLGDLRRATSEWLGLLVYQFTDKTTDLLPGPCDRAGAAESSGQRPE